MSATPITPEVRISFMPPADPNPDSYEGLLTFSQTSAEASHPLNPDFAGSSPDVLVASKEGDQGISPILGDTVARDYAEAGQSGIAGERSDSASSGNFFTRAKEALIAKR